MASMNIIETTTATTNNNNDEKKCSEISIKEFLNFLKSAYQVQESIEGVLKANGMAEAINWLNLKDNTMIQKVIDDRQDADDTKSTSIISTDQIKRKLNEVLAEGLLDSVLPYLVTSSSSSSSSSIAINTNNQIHAIGSRRNSQNNCKSVGDKSYLTQGSSNDRIIKKKSSEVLLVPVASSVSKTDSEVEIHVCDEMKNTKKNFVCNQTLLIEKMGYFADVMTTGQRLDDMDISVHCDIGIFEWLMRWVKRDSLLEQDWPKLDTQCIIPILVSAAFLQMDPLLHDCLLFCHQSMNDILRTSTNLSCLNDSVMTRLAAMYTNTEVEQIRDRKDKIQSRLYAKLIQSLGELEPESVRGHWNSLALIYRCAKCEQIVYPLVEQKIPCKAQCMRLQYDGSIVSRHVRDATTWNINDHILQLYKVLKTWRKVYWRLWGNAHFLYCMICKRYFPTHQIGWCRYHPDAPQFFTLDAQKAPLPVGRYPCCGERAYRFQLLPNYSGCQFRDHSVCIADSGSEINNVRDSAVWTMLDNYRQLIEEEPPELMFPERLTRLVARDPTSGSGGAGGGADKKLICKESFWWDGFEIVPPRPKMGLLTMLLVLNMKNNSGDKDHYLGFDVNDGSITTPLAIRSSVQSSDDEESSEDDDDSSNSSTTTTTTNSDSSAISQDSGESDPPPRASALRPPPTPQIQKKKITTTVTNTPRRKKQRTKRNKRPGRLWQNNLSARSNQDMQRAYEEQTFKRMAAILNRRINITTNSCHQPSVVANNHNNRGSRNVGSTPIGGTWVRLEAEWRDLNSMSNSSANNNNNNQHSSNKLRTNVYCTGGSKLKAGGVGKVGGLTK